MKDATADSLAQRIDKVTRMLSAEDAAPPSLASLSRAAALSPWHFHRVWRAMTGETLGDTVRRLRLERAAARLAGSAASVTEIALDAGFASSQAFAKAFRRAAGTTPSAYRAAGGGPLAAPARMSPDAGLKVEIVEIEPFTVIARRKPGSHASLHGEFGAVMRWAQGADLAHAMRGIWGMPVDAREGLEFAPLHYDAGFDFGPGAAAPSGLVRLEIPGQRYARLRHLGAYEGVEPAMDRLARWLAGSGHAAADAPFLNHFLNDPGVTPEADLITDIHLPLRTP